MKKLVPALLLLAACSGGGSGEVTIAAQNAEAVAGQGLAAVETLTDMSEMVSAFLGAFEGDAQTVPCDGGNVNLTLDDVAPEGQLSTGDSASLQFQACVFDFFGQSVTLNGRLTLRAEAVAGAPPGPFMAAVSVVFDGFTVVGPGGTLVVDGDFLLEAGSDDGVTFWTAVSGTRFSAFAQEGGDARSVTLSRFRLEQTFDEESGAYTGSLEGDVASSELGGTVTFDTPVLFQGVDPADPSSGAFLVTGAGGSTLTMVVLNEVDVRLLVDLDGDGGADVTIDTTWAQLRGE